jgi:TatD DNase family protein
MLPTADQFIDIHTHHPALTENIFRIASYRIPSEERLCRENIGPASAGIHPWDTNVVTGKDLQTLESICSRSSVLAIGEAGLDRASNIPLEIQWNWFDHQIRLAADLKKPMILHSVRSYADLMQIGKRFHNPPVMILHGYTGNEHTTRRLINHGYYFSFGEALLSRASIHNILPVIPSDRLFFETDTAQCGIESVYRQASELLNLELTTLKKLVFYNFMRIFTTRMIKDGMA